MKPPRDDDHRNRRLAELIVVRHGQSLANVAFAAEPAGVAEAELARLGRDADVALSESGWEQAAGVGRWLAALAPGRRPDLVICSPYRRARQTWRAAAAVASATRPPDPVLDRRLVDRRMGDWELMTPAAMVARFPDACERRNRVGPFHHRPPCGESFSDVAARVGDFLREWSHRGAGRRLLVVAHDSTVLMFRHLIEGIPVDSITPMLTAPIVANASITRFVDDGRADGLRLVEFNKVDHLRSGPLANPPTTEFEPDHQASQ